MSETRNECGMHEALVSYLYGEAAPDERRTVETHLEACRACKDELEGFQRVRGILQQWQLDDLPVVRVAVDPRRSFVSVLKELFSIAPLWAKAAGAVAMALLVFAVMGTDIRIGGGTASFHADLLRRSQSAVTPSEIQGADLERVRADVKGLVTQLVAESEQRRDTETRTQLVALQSRVESMRSEDLARLATRIQEHQTKIRTLERDIDRREGSDLTDILFSEMTKPRGENIASGGGQ